MQASDYFSMQAGDYCDSILYLKSRYEGTSLLLKNKTNKFFLAEVDTIDSCCEEFIKGRFSVYSENGEHKDSYKLDIECVVFNPPVDFYTGYNRYFTKSPVRHWQQGMNMSSYKFISTVGDDEAPMDYRYHPGLFSILSILNNGYSNVVKNHNFKERLTDWNSKPLSDKPNVDNELQYIIPCRDFMIASVWGNCLIKYKGYTIGKFKGDLEAGMVEDLPNLIDNKYSFLSKVFLNQLERRDNEFS